MKTRAAVCEPLVSELESARRFLLRAVDPIPDEALMARIQEMGTWLSIVKRVRYQICPWWG